MKNILVTSIGSMSAPFVIDVLRQMGLNIIGTDIYDRRWISTSEKVKIFEQVTKVDNSEKYYREIFEILDKYSADAILPLADFDVDFFANYHKEFQEAGVSLLMVSPHLVKDLRDKFSVFNTLKETKISVIPTFTASSYLDSQNIFPCVAKKVNGRSSYQQYIIHDKEELKLNRFSSNDYIVQPYIQGDVIVADLIFNNGNPVFIARRELTRTVNGAGLAVEIIEDKRIDQILKQFYSYFPVKGCLNIEFIDNGSDLFLMDVNPRFSAGVVYSNMAGYNFVRNHLNSFLNLQIDLPTKINSGSIYTREYMEKVVN